MHCQGRGRNYEIDTAVSAGASRSGGGLAARLRPRIGSTRAGEWECTDSKKSLYESEVKDVRVPSEASARRRQGCASGATLSG